MLFSSYLTSILGFRNDFVGRQTLVKRSWTFDSSYTIAHQAIINLELPVAKQIVDYAAQNPLENNLYKDLFPASTYNDNKFADTLTGIYSRVSELLDPNSSAPPFTILCGDAKQPKCVSANWIGAFNNGAQKMFLCDRWFVWRDIPNRLGLKVEPTATKLAQAKDLLNTCFAWRDIVQARAHTLIHELMHNSYSRSTDKDQGIALDYAYGPTDCLKLPTGNFIRTPDKYKSAEPMCPDQNDATKEGNCDPNLALMNADSLAIHTGVLYFTHQRGSTINQFPILSLTKAKRIPQGTLLANRDITSCPVVPIDILGGSPPDDGDMEESDVNWEEGDPIPSAPPSEPVDSVYPFTTTLLNGEVDQCQSSTIADYGGFHETMCAGATAVLYTPPPKPYYSVQVGQHGVNVETLTSSALYSSISSALDKLCPSPTGSSGACATSTVTIGGIDYIEPITEAKEQGSLAIAVDSSNYGSDSVRQDMIVYAARTAIAGASTNNSCQEQGYQVAEYRAVARENITLCNAPSFAGVQFYDAKSSGTAGWLDARWEFETWSGGPFNCAEVLDGINVVLDVVAPEAAAELGLDFEGVTAVCEEVMAHFSSITSVYGGVTSIIGQIIP